MLPIKKGYSCVVVLDNDKISGVRVIKLVCGRYMLYSRRRTKRKLILETKQTQRVDNSRQPPAFPSRAYPLPCGPYSYSKQSLEVVSGVNDDDAHLAVTSMTIWGPLFLGEATRIKQGIAFRTT